MTQPPERYLYSLKVDQQTKGYNAKWLNFDIPVSVIATDYEGAKKEALRILHPPRNDTCGWSFFLKGVTPYEDPWPPPPVVDELAFEPIPRKKIRLKGAR